MDQITSNLWISDIESVQWQSTKRFDRIISVCQDTARDNVSDECTYEHYCLADDEQSVERWGGSCSYTTFSNATMNIMWSLLFEYTTCVHCHHGKNRSVSTAAAALSVLYDVPLDSVFQWIQVCRPIADPDRLMREHAREFVRRYE
jgi:hypothetical protein